MSNRQTGTVVTDAMKPNGRVEIFVTRGSPRIDYRDQIGFGAVPVYKDHSINFDGCQKLDEMVLKNIIVNQGKDKMIEALVGGTVDKVLRMAIGDRGTIPSDNSVPKVPTPDMTALYHEIYRSDLDAVIVNTGTPDVHEVKFIKVFAARDIPLSAYANQVSPIVNEVGIITAGDQVPFPRPSSAPPVLPSDDEKLFAMRTYRAVPFEAASDIEITFRYTVYID